MTNINVAGCSESEEQEDAVEDGGGGGGGWDSAVQSGVNSRMSSRRTVMRAMRKSMRVVLNVMSGVSFPWGISMASRRAWRDSSRSSRMLACVRIILESQERAGQW